MSIVAATSSVVQDLMESADERELWIVGREFERPPYFHAGKGGDTRLARALRLCTDDKITPNSDGSYQVEGSEGRSYRVADSCSCPNSQKATTKWCYHAVGVALYVEWQRRLHPLLLPSPPATVEQRLAQTPKEDPMPDTADAYIPEPEADAAPLQPTPPRPTPTRGSPRVASLPAGMTDMLKALMPDIRTLLPPDIAFATFRAALWLELTGTRQLAECTSDSLRAAAIKAALYGLLPGKDCHLLPFRTRGTLEATFVANYFGVLLTLERSGKVAKAFAHPVYEGDEFSLDYFADDFHHVPYSVRERPPGAIRFYYGAVKMKDGITHVEVLSLDQIEAVRQRAPAHDQGPWVTDRLAMSRKTALKACAKYVHLTPQQAQLLHEDDARERTDIPPERHQRNVTDLYGDAAGETDHA